MKTLASVLAFFIAISATFGQSYRVYFSDKGENTELLKNPELFLSTKSISNKTKRNVEIDVSDLPVSKSYLDEISQQNFSIKMKSRWFNYALIEGENPEQLLKLSFVKKIETPKKYLPVFTKTGNTAMLTYGASGNQIEMVNGDYLHNLGFLGQGMTIAVLDGGFSGAQNLDGLDSLFLRGRVDTTYSFVTKSSNVFTGGSHGTKVLSIMGGYIDQQFVGSAPRANYLLLTSEDESSEKPVEMDNWLAAAEFADSAGADVINSSLGYNEFDGGVGDFEYKDLDGNTTIVTRAADMAAKKGILVVVSAGNEGVGSWKKITAPADGDSVLAIGAVDVNEKYAAFSGKGPSFDGRIKPDVVAMGQGTSYISSLGPLNGNGTSFSTPVVAGLAACLWQSKLSKTNMEIYDAIKFNASQRFAPDNFRGFGVVNFRDASWSISINENRFENLEIAIFPNPVKETFTVSFNGLEKMEQVSISIVNPAGQQLGFQEFSLDESNEISLKAPAARGVYFLHIKIEGTAFIKKIIR